MAMEPVDPHRMTYRSMRVSMLLILITVGVPGCLSGAGAFRPPSAPQPSTSPTTYADPARVEPPPVVPDPESTDPRSADPVRSGAATSEPEADRRWRERHRPSLGHPAQHLPATPDPSAWPDLVVPEDRAVAQDGHAGSSDQVSPEHQVAARQPVDGPPPGYRRSLVYSGLSGLAISVIGLAMVGRRRRFW